VELRENPPPIEVRAEARPPKLANYARGGVWAGFDQDSTREHVWKPETTIDAVVVRGDERSDVDGGSAHEVQLEDSPPPQTLAKPADASLKECPGEG
jgi:hypothetical protein